MSRLFLTRILLVIVIQLHLLPPSTAQKKPFSSEGMTWIELIESVKISPKFSTTLLWHHRVFFDRDQTYQDIYWASANYSFARHFKLSAGFIRFNYHRQVTDEFISIPENRPFQSITYHTRFNKTKAYCRFMLEQRYMGHVEDGYLMEECKFNLRFRNRFRVYIPLSERWKLDLSEEMILNGQQLDVDIFNQSRTWARLHYQVGKCRFNAGYLHWLVNTRKELQNRHTLIVGAVHRLEW